jgi:hypothetical protein
VRSRSVKGKRKGVGSLEKEKAAGASSKLQTRFGPLKEDTAHHFGGGIEEMGPALPGTAGVVSDQSKVRLVDQGGGRDRLPGPFVRQSMRGQPPQFVVDQPQELFGGLRVASLKRRQELLYLAHGPIFPDGIS